MVRNLFPCTVLVVGILSAAAPARAGLENASFEKTKLSPWETMVSATTGNKGGEAEVSLDPEVSHSGKQSLRLHGDAETVTWYGLTQAMRVVPGERYLLSGWIRTDKVRQEGRQYQNCGFFAQFRDGNGNTVKVRGYPAVGTAPVLGTRDWHRVDKVIRVPEAAISARVGCQLTLSGTAWFDDVALERLPHGEWNNLKTKRFTYHWEGTEKPSEAVIRENEENLGKLESLLGVKHEGPVLYHKYSSKERIEELTGKAGNAHVENGNEVHSIWWRDRHEVVHLLTKQWGEGTALLGEGIAVFLSGEWQGRDVDAWVPEFAAEGRLPDIRNLISTLEFRTRDDAVTYPVAGSWVKALVEAHGIKKFRSLYRKVPMNPIPAEFDAQFRNVYGMTFEDHTQGWKKKLGL